jgi:ankyrin repeat protein
MIADSAWRIIEMKRNSSVNRLTVLMLVLISGVAVLRAADPDRRVVDAAKAQDKATLKVLIQQKVDVNVPQADGASALQWAAHWNDLAMADMLITAGAKVNAANDYGVTPLKLAIDDRSTAMVQRLLKAGADANAKTWTGETMLMAAAASGNVDAVKALIAAGANVNAAEPRRGQTALMWAISDQWTNVAKVLIDAGADVNATTHMRKEKGFTPMEVNGYGAIIHPTPLGGYTPLLFAAREGDLETAKLLLDKGAKVNWASPEDGTALIIASAGGYEQLAMFLLDRGADPNVVDASGIAPLHYAMRDGIKVLHGIPITNAKRICQGGAGGRCVSVEAAAQAPNSAQLSENQASSTSNIYERNKKDRDSLLSGGNMPNLMRSLLAHGADPNVQMKTPPARLRLRRKPTVNMTGATPFLLAAAAGDTMAMRTLIEGKAKPAIGTVVDPKEFLKDGYGDDNQIQGNATPLMVAVGIGRQDDLSKDEEAKALESAKILLGLGANVNAATETGWTAIHAASFLGANTLIEFLVEKGADVNAMTGCGQTALTLAEGTMARGLLQRVTPHPATAQLLRKLGAVDKPSTKPAGRCVEGRFGLDYATVNSAETKERTEIIEENKKKQE